MPWAVEKVTKSDGSEAFAVVCNEHHGMGFDYAMRNARDIVDCLVGPSPAMPEADRQQLLEDFAEAASSEELIAMDQYLGAETDVKVFRDNPESLQGQLLDASGGTGNLVMTILMETLHKRGRNFCLVAWNEELGEYRFYQIRFTSQEKPRHRGGDFVYCLAA